jgi:type IV pilus assembly protein PilW
VTAQRRSGFTLIELLVAVVISGILVTAILQLVRSQGQFARVQTAREEVQQNARAAVDLIAAELRGVGWGGISSGGEDEISFASPTAWGVACGDDPAGAVVLFPPDAVVALNAPAAGLAVTQLGYAAAFYTATDVTNGAGLDAVVNRCRAELKPDPDIEEAPTIGESRVRVYAGLSGVEPGTPVYRFADVTYAIGEIDGRRWILRNGQQFAGPVVESGEGMRFRYLAADGATLVGKEAARSIGISITTRSRGSVNQSTQTDRASTIVYLRNRS